VVGDIAPTECLRLTHTLKYEEKFGVFLSINYCNGEIVHHQVPLTTLSLLEAHATANELLSRIEYALSIAIDPIEAAVVKRETAEILSDLLNDTSRLEYSVLVHLTKIHFSELDLRSLFGLIATLSRLSLNVEFQTLGFIANRIEETFMNRRLGHFISMELRRDSQRALIFFKTILFMYEWKELLDDEKEMSTLN